MGFTMYEKKKPVPHNAGSEIQSCLGMLKLISWAVGLLKESPPHPPKKNQKKIITSFWFKVVNSPIYLIQREVIEVFNVSNLAFELCFHKISSLKRHHREYLFLTINWVYVFTIWVISLLCMKHYSKFKAHYCLCYVSFTFATICISRVQCFPPTSVRQQYTLDSPSNWNILLRNERISFGEYRKIWCYGFRSCKYNVCHPTFTIDTWLIVSDVCRLGRNVLF